VSASVTGGSDPHDQADVADRGVTVSAYVVFASAKSGTPRNLGDYARQPNVAACGGSWIASREAISTRKFDDIVVAAQEACTILRRAREQRGEAA
jgi:2-keto-3-deoxy-6-phosphogluconate aldolase